MTRLRGRKRTDERDAERVMLPVRDAIEQRWLEDEAAAAAAAADDQDLGIDPDLELAALTNPNVTIVFLDPDQEA